MNPLSNVIKSQISIQNIEDETELSAMSLIQGQKLVQVLFSYKTHIAYFYIIDPYNQQQEMQQEFQCFQTQLKYITCVVSNGVNQIAFFNHSSNCLQILNVEKGEFQLIDKIPIPSQLCQKKQKCDDKFLREQIHIVYLKKSNCIVICENVLQTKQLVVRLIQLSTLEILLEELINVHSSDFIQMWNLDDQNYVLIANQIQEIGKLNYILIDVKQKSIERQQAYVQLDKFILVDAKLLSDQKKILFFANITKQGCYLVEHLLQAKNPQCSVIEFPKLFNTGYVEFCLKVDSKKNEIWVQFDTEKVDDKEYLAVYEINFFSNALILKEKKIYRHFQVYDILVDGDDYFEIPYSILNCSDLPEIHKAIPYLDNDNQKSIQLNRSVNSYAQLYHCCKESGLIKLYQLDTIQLVLSKLKKGQYQ